MKKSILFLLAACLCFSFISDIQKRTIRDNGFDIECYVSLKKLSSFNQYKTYYWFKSGKIHKSRANASGNVLHESFSKFFRSNQIAAQGFFNYGLKDGEWKYWSENGNLDSLIHWNKGLKNGDYFIYDAQGKMKVKGTYRNNFKSGKWINYTTKDTVYYKNNTTYKEKPKSFLQRILKRKDSTQKAQIKRERISKKRIDSINRAKLKAKKLLVKKRDSINKSRKKGKSKSKAKQ
ncbi:hypothetical protein [uncultured Algibacter sp.]|uniref:toxin-antitoxin system YwqK family antitoxin n=1 Tax=uncultured Algibacter sp. TaxID=298659 RepID=UPI003217AA5D